MYVFADVDMYLNMITGAENYTAITDPIAREKLVFSAYDRLLSYYSEPLLTPKIIGLQALYMANQDAAKGTELEAIERIKSTGAKSYSLDGVAVSFDSGSAPAGISPEVAAILAALKPAAFVSRLI